MSLKSSHGDLTIFVKTVIVTKLWQISISISIGICISIIFFYYHYIPISNT